MNRPSHFQIIALVGLSGSGKTTAVNYLTSKGFPKVYFGGIILDGMQEAGIAINEENEHQFREELRAREGKDVIVKKIIAQLFELADAGQHKVVADGLYSWTEYKALKHAFPGELTVVAVVAPKHLRYRRLHERVIRPLTDSEASERDWSEIENLEKGGPIAIADYYIHNDEDQEKLEHQLDTICREINFYD